MSYKIVDYTGNTVNDGFKTYGEAFKWMHSLFTDDHIKLMDYLIIPNMEDKDE